jgi:hypothetical protein
MIQFSIIPQGFLGGYKIRPINMRYLYLILFLNSFFVYAESKNNSLQFMVIHPNGDPVHMSKSANSLQLSINSFWGSAAGFENGDSWNDVADPYFEYITAKEYMTRVFFLSNDLKRHDNKDSFDVYADTIIPGFSSYAIFNKDSNLEKKTVHKENEKLNFGFQSRLSLYLIGEGESCTSGPVSPKEYYFDFTSAQIGHQSLMSIVEQTYDSDKKCIAAEEETEGADTKCDKTIGKSMISAVDKILNSENHWLLATQTQIPTITLAKSSKKDEAVYYKTPSGSRKNIIYDSDGARSSHYETTDSNTRIMSYLINKESNLVDTNLAFSLEGIEDGVNSALKTFTISENESVFNIRLTAPVLKRLCNRKFDM